MSSQKEQKIGERISFVWHEESLTVIIDQKISRTQQMMLDAWMLGWIFVGGSFALGYSLAKEMNKAS
jgi:hypothetical protein